MADQLATPADLAALLQQDVDTATATLLVEIATAVVQAVAEQRIVRVADDTVTLDLDGYDAGVYLPLPERPVAAVGAVLIGSTAVTDYAPQLSRGRLWRARGWRSTLVSYFDQPSAVTVTYTHGYATGHQKLQLARGTVLSLAAGQYDNPSGANRQIRIDDYAATYEAMMAQVTDTLRVLIRRQYGRPPGSVPLVIG